MTLTTNKQNKAVTAKTKTKFVKLDIETFTMTSVTFEVDNSRTMRIAKTNQGLHIGNGFYTRLRVALKEHLKIDALVYASNDQVSARMIEEPDSLNKCMLFIKPVGAFSFNRSEIEKICKLLSEHLEDMGLYRGGQSAVFVSSALSKSSESFSGKLVGHRGILYPIFEYVIIFR